MKRFVVIGLAMAALTLAGVSYALSDPDPFDSAWGGGNATTALGSRDFSLKATRLGNAGARGEVVFGRIGFAAPSITLAVTCLNVDGNKAAVGGTVTSSSVSEIVGGFGLLWLVDNGNPASGTRDQITLMDVYRPTDVLPVPSTNTCPAADVPSTGFAYYDMTGGDIVVNAVR